jgi:hypothetical protein
MNIYFFDKKYFYYSISYFFSLSFQTISRQIIFVNKIKKRRPTSGLRNKKKEKSSEKSKSKLLFLLSINLVLTSISFLFDNSLEFILKTKLKKCHLIYFNLSKLI